MNYAKQKHSPGNSCVSVIKVTNTKMSPKNDELKNITHYLHV